MEYEVFKAHHLALLVSTQAKTGLNFIEIFKTCATNIEYQQSLQAIGEKMRDEHGIPEIETINMFKRHATEINEHVFGELKKLLKSKKTRLLTQKRHLKGDEKAPLLN